MIDKKTRGKIIELWEEGESKASIQRETGVSQPTIRRILKEAGLEKSSRINGDESSDFGSQMLEERMADMEEEIENLKQNRRASPIKENIGSTVDIQPADSLVINLSRNYPYRHNGPWQILRNGLPIWDLPRILEKIFPRRIVFRILDEVHRQGGAGKVYGVEIIHKRYGLEEVRVQPLK